MVCLGGAVTESFVLPKRAFWDSVIFDVSGHALYLRLIITSAFLVFALIVARALRQQRSAEHTIKERSGELEEAAACCSWRLPNERS